MKEVGGRTDPLGSFWSVGLPISIMSIDINWKGDGWSNTLAHIFRFLTKEVYLKNVKDILRIGHGFPNVMLCFQTCIFMSLDTFNDVICEQVAGLYLLDF